MVGSDFVSYVAVSLGAVGSVLSIINTINALSQRKVHLKVSPAQAIIPNSNTVLVSVDVTNLSTFPITVNEIGMTIHRSKSRVVVFQPTVIDGGPFPRRLEPRESVCLLFDPKEASGEYVGKTYAKTACGVLATGTSPAFQQLREMIRSGDFTA